MSWSRSFRQRLLIHACRDGIGRQVGQARWPEAGTGSAFDVQCLAIVIPAERLQAREPGPKYPCGASFQDAGVPGSRIGSLTRAVRDDDRNASTKTKCDTLPDMGRCK